MWKFLGVAAKNECSIEAGDWVRCGVANACDDNENGFYDHDYSFF